jgi:hypothetical protein
VTSGRDRVDTVTDETDQQPPDPWASVQNDLTQDLMRTFMGMPSVLQAGLEGAEGPVDLTSEEYAEAMVKVQQLVLRHLPNIAGTAALAYGMAKALQARVEELERKLDQTE